jgi:hypothetical protein
MQEQPQRECSRIYIFENLLRAGLMRAGLIIREMRSCVQKRPAKEKEEAHASSIARSRVRL